MAIEEIKEELKFLKESHVFPNLKDHIKKSEFYKFNSNYIELRDYLINNYISRLDIKNDKETYQIMIELYYVIFQIGAIRGILFEEGNKEEISIEERLAQMSEEERNILEEETEEHLDYISKTWPNPDLSPGSAASKDILERIAIIEKKYNLTSQQYSDYVQSIL